MFKKILVPLDGSDMAEAVLQPVRELADCMGADVIALRVVVPIAMDYAAMRGDIVWQKQLEQSMMTEADTYVHRIADRLKSQGLKATSALKYELAVADTILAYADQNGVDLIAMSTHGRSGIGRWLIGSVADRVVHGARIPVLLVRPEASKPHGA